MTPKLIYLEAIRGCASVIVVITHFAAAFFPYSVFGSEYISHGHWEKFFVTTPLSLVFAGHFAVCLFFLLSGYVLSLPYFGMLARDSDNIKAAVIKRPIRLGGIVLFTVLLSYLFLNFSWFLNIPASSVTGSIPWFSRYFSQDIPSLKNLIIDLVTRLFSTGSLYNPPLWTIEIELYGSFFTYAFLLLFRMSKLRHLAYIAAIVYLKEYHGFIFGILIADLVKTFPNIFSGLVRSRVSLPILISGILFASLPNYVKQEDLGNTFYSIFPQLDFLNGSYSMLGSIFVFVSILLNPGIQSLLSRKIFAYLGRISFAVYAIHFLILSSLTSWLFILLEPALDYYFACTIAAISYLLVTFSVAHLLTIYIDEPTTKLANKVARSYLSSLESA